MRLAGSISKCASYFGNFCRRVEEYTINAWVMSGVWKRAEFSSHMVALLASCGSVASNWLGRERTVNCKSCGSDKQSKFAGEICIHFSGLKNRDKPVVWVFPELVVCLDCGTAEFAVPEGELRVLAKGDAAAAG